MMNSEIQKSKRIRSVFDEIRGLWVKATPEEIIRQNWIKKLIHQLGFPKELIGVEVNLQELRYLDIKAPMRRADLICFGKEIHPAYPLYPLLLIEVKDKEISSKALEQLLGYNHFVKAFFVALVNKNGVFFGFYEREGYRFTSFMPSYEELLEALKK
jgi:hypothetical protein